MATVVYPAVVERAGETYSVYFPDLPGCTSAGDTAQQAVLNAEEALTAHLLECAREGDEVGEPSVLGVIEVEPDVDIFLVRAEMPT